MNESFGQAAFDAQGQAIFCTKDSSMGMDIKIVNLTTGKPLIVSDEDKETAILLLSGKVEFCWDGKKETAARCNCFEERAWCLHICRQSKAVITAQTDAELLVQSADNDRFFAPKLYHPEEIRLEKARYDVWESTAKRDIMTVFDYNNAPYSKMVLGEIITYPGRWSSYPPHYHSQPEVYFYRFDKPQGFGACFIGDHAYKIRDHCYACIPGELCHPQAAAPGYRMYYAWMIHHLPRNPWTKRFDDPCHQWLYGMK